LLRADLHVHSCYSWDCRTPLEEIISRCLQIGISCVAIADHHTIAGALKLKEIAPFKVIVAEEVLTSAGELMGLFLTEVIPKGLSPQETIARIRAQGGLVSIPHPFGRSPLQNAKELLSEDIISQIDVIEVFNSRTPFPSSSTKAWKLAKEHRLAASAGSDAHTPREIGRAYVEMPEFDGSDDFLDCLSKGRIFGQRSSPLIHFASTWAKVRNRLA
jgi:predicted metal-dependent phosphoesterase TrpH